MNEKSLIINVFVLACGIRWVSAWCARSRFFA